MKVRLVAFPGGFNLPIWVAEKQGFFAREGLSLEFTPTPNSVAQMEGLAAGDFDIAMTAFDNVVAYAESWRGREDIGCEPVAVLGADGGFLSLVAAPDCAQLSDLAGRTLAVDAMTTGYAFVLFAMLERAGLWPDKVTLESFGGVAQRWEALRARKHDGTLLITPFDVMAEGAGFHVLGAARDVIGPLQGVVAAVDRAWASRNSPKLLAFLRGYLAALDWLSTDSNRPEALDILLTRAPNLPRELAEPVGAKLLDPDRGFSNRGAIDLAGCSEVLRLRKQFGPDIELSPLDSYIDLSYWARVVA